MSILAAHMSRRRVVVGVDTAMQLDGQGHTWQGSKLFALPAAGCVIGGVGCLDVVLACFAQSLTLRFDEIADGFADITATAWAKVAAGATSSPHARRQPTPAVTYLAGWDERCAAMRAFCCGVSWEGQLDFSEVRTQALLMPVCGLDPSPLSGAGDPIELVRETARLQVQRAAADNGEFRFGGRLIVADLCAPEVGRPWLAMSEHGEL